MRLLAFGGLVLAVVALLILAAPAPSNPDRFYAAEREAIAVEHARLGLEEARWSSQARQMAWQQQLTAPQVVYVEQQAAPSAPSLVAPVLVLMAVVVGAGLLTAGALVALILTRRTLPIDIPSAYSGETVYLRSERERTR